MKLSDEEIQRHIKDNCRNDDGTPAMDEQCFYEGAKWARESMTNEEALTDHNCIVVAGFMEHCKDEGFELPDSLFESYFDA